MGVKGDGGANYYSRTTGVPAWNAFSACGWAYMDWDIGLDTFWKFFLSFVDGSSHGLFMGIPQGGGNPLAAESYDGGTTVDVAVATTPTRLAWFFWGLSQAGAGGTDLKAYCFRPWTDTVLQSASGAGLSFTPTTIQLLANSAFGEEWEGGIASAKIWDAVLSTAAFEREVRSLTPHRWANLNSWYPFLGDSLQDWSGNGRTLTRVGTPAVANNPPVTWGGPQQGLALADPAMVPNPTIPCRISDSGRMR
jgi:hypothetical protein